MIIRERGAMAKMACGLKEANPDPLQFYCGQGGTMNNEIGVIAGIGLDQKTRKSRWPARLDLVQSASGLFLGLFMVVLHR
jgi:hypothetical protein